MRLNNANRSMVSRVGRRPPVLTSPMPVPRFWRRLQAMPATRRRAIKGAILAVVVFLVLYPDPLLFVRHVRHLFRLDTLPDPNHPALPAVNARFDAYLAEHKVNPDDTGALLEAVEGFVHREVPYSWDWEVWGVADYLPTLDELFQAGTEDCDGRALLAAALLRHRDIPARIVGDPRHLWVRTPFGDTMGPLGEPVFRFDEDGLHVDWGRLLDPRPLTLGIAVFPFAREMIILLTMWLLLVPVGVSRRRAGGALLMMIGALVLLRLAGQIHLMELGDVAERHRLGAGWYGILAWASLHLIGGLLLLRMHRQPEIHTDRSACKSVVNAATSEDCHLAEHTQPARDGV